MDIIKFFDTSNIKTIFECEYRESLLPSIGQDVCFQNCDNREDILSVTARIDSYMVTNIYRMIYNDGSVVVHVDIKNNRSK